MGAGRRDGLAVRGLPPLILREPQHERPHTRDGGLGGGRVVEDFAVYYCYGNGEVADFFAGGVEDVAVD